MLSMTEVLAQAVYGMSLRDLPLSMLSSTPHRKRVHSVERPLLMSATSKTSNRQDRRLSSTFGDISILQQVPQPRLVRRRTIVNGGDASSSLGEEDTRLPAESENQESANKSLNLQRGNLSSILERSGQGSTSVEEEASHIVELTGVKKETVEVPCAEKTEIDDVEIPWGTEKPVDVIVNPNPTSPVSIVDHSSTASQESLVAEDLDCKLGQPLLEGPTSKKSRRSAATNIFKHRSPDVKQKKKSKIPLEQFDSSGGHGSLTRYSPLLSYDDGQASGKGKRKKKSTWHKRSGSDTTSLTVNKEGSPSSLVKNTIVHPEEDVNTIVPKSNKSISPPVDSRKHLGPRLSIPKSASEGNIHRISLESFLRVSDDSMVSPMDCSFRRVATIGSPQGASESSSVQDLSIIVETSISMPVSGSSMSKSLPPGLGGHSKHMIQRSMTVDSPEPGKVTF